jgi:peroxiredoxin
MAFGACSDQSAKTPKRYTFVIGPDGRIEQSIDTKDPAHQAESLLAGLR